TGRPPRCRERHHTMWDRGAIGAAPPDASPASLASREIRREPFVLRPGVFEPRPTSVLPLDSVTDGPENERSKNGAAPAAGGIARQYPVGATCADAPRVPSACCTILMPALAPTRLAPAATIACSPSRSRTPPAALTPMSAPTTRRISATSWIVAPPGPK